MTKLRVLFTTKSHPREAIDIEKATITFGRRPDCDVTFDQRVYGTVSGLHAEVTRRDGRLWISDRGSRNGTFVNGRVVAAPTSLEPKDVVMLGENGPTLRVQSACADAAEVRAPVRGGTVLNARAAHDEQERARGGLRRLFGQPVGQAIASIGSLGRRRPQRGVAAARAREDDRRSVGMNTLFGAIENAVGRERRKSRVVVALAAALLAAGGGIAWGVLAGNAERMASRLEASASDDMVQAARILEECVYLVRIQDRSGDRWVDSSDCWGTAWHAGKGHLATNVHVAVSFPSQAGPNRRMIARRHADQQPVEVHITKVILHPGYEAFNRLVDEVRPWRPGAEFLEPTLAWDVALMEVAESDRSKLGQPLTLAGSEVLSALSTGDVLGYAGFPSEGVQNSGTDPMRPVPTFREGRLSKVQDFFMSPAHPSDGHFFTISTGAAGGASGSPIVDRTGRVLALLNSGDVVAGGITGPRVSGINTYGMRVDTLKELIDGRADACTAERLPMWTTRLHAAWRDGLAPFEETFPRDVGASVVRRLAEARERPLTFQGLAEEARERFRFAAPKTPRVFVPTLRRGVYVIFAVAKDRPVRLGMNVQLPPGSEPRVVSSHYRGQWARGTWWACATVLLPSDARIRVEVVPSEDEPNVASDIELRCLRIETT